MIIKQMNSPALFPGLDPAAVSDTVVMESATPAPYLHFPAFDRLVFLKLAFSTRLGGTSTGYRSSMDLSFHENEPETAAALRAEILQNFQNMADSLAVPVSQMVYSKQTHTANVRIVTAADRGKGILKSRDFTDTDGLITNEPGVCLVTSYADCIPLFFADPVHKVIAASHAGWRGTVHNIAANTVTLMQSAFHCDPEAIQVLIGPGICGDCYEISSDVADIFSAAYSAQDCRQILKEAGEGKFRLNLQLANYLHLTAAGVQPSHISIADVCTCCNPSLLFSHRASHGKRGTMCGFLVMNETAREQ